MNTTGNPGRQQSRYPITWGKHIGPMVLPPFHYLSQALGEHDESLPVRFMPRCLSQCSLRVRCRYQAPFCAAINAGRRTAALGVPRPVAGSQPGTAL